MNDENKSFIFRISENDYKKTDLYLTYLKKNSEMMDYLKSKNIT